MAGGGASKRAGRGARRDGPALPDSTGDAPLQALTRDRLSVFLYVSLLPDEARAIAKDLGLSVPGFRQNTLGDVEICDLIADEIRAAPPARVRVLDTLRKTFVVPPLVRTALDRVGAEDLLTTGSSDQGLVLALWRVLADPDAEVRDAATAPLEDLVKRHYGPPEGEAAPGEAAAGEGAPEEALLEDLAPRVAELEKALEEAKQRVESVRRKGEEQREKLQSWLKEARAREAQAVEEAARAREASDAAGKAREKAEAALAAARSTDAAADAQRARAAAREQEARATGLEARLARQEERERDLESRLAAAESRAKEAERPAGPGAPAAEAASDEAEEAPASWLLPVFSREFYDSLAGWDRRIQRAAFKQAYLLAQDHRHPSLRALPLEGLPGYYRVRVATDVRLLYRRVGERQNEIEILSLIDREDLDRYVRQAKTRG